MDAAEIERALAVCELRLREPGVPDLRALGFWRAVTAVKRQPELVERFAERIGDIDRRGFLARVRVVTPIGVGIALLVMAKVVGVGFVVSSFVLADKTIAGLAMLVGAGALIAATHDLAHLVVGGVVGIRFTHFYTDIPKRPQPGLKIDYASYLRTPPAERAWMHAAGAIATKLVPFVLIPLSYAAGLPQWAVVLLAAIGVVQVVTDLLFSVRVGDWKKFGREMRLAEQAGARSR